MNCDIIFVAILAKLTQKLLNKSGVLDYLLTFWVMAMFYAIPKALVLGYFWGFTFPFNGQPWPQFISGAVSFVLWLALILFRQHQMKVEAKGNL